MVKVTYDIVFGKTPEILRKNVNEKLQEGWILYEGVVFAEGRYHQAILLYPPPPALELPIPRYVEDYAQPTC